MRVLDAGCGAGRYSIEFAKKGCKVTLFDISDEQLKIAKEKVYEANVEENIDGIFEGDIRNLSQYYKKREVQIIYLNEGMLIEKYNFY
jgi:cyclopropane fatty-acyl-phospholipid synthase-like methyltransferase